MPINSLILSILEYFKQDESQNDVSSTKFKKPDAYKNINSFTILSKK
jgi:hypothetical protein